MIAFKKDQYFIIDETQLDKNETKLFIQLLEKEKLRHIMEKDKAVTMYATCKTNLETQFHFSAFKRHIQDIDAIDKTLDYLRKKWNL